jgi:hypothetical protein
MDETVDTIRGRRGPSYHNRERKEASTLAVRYGDFILVLEKSEKRVVPSPREIKEPSAWFSLIRGDLYEVPSLLAMWRSRMKWSWDCEVILRASNLEFGHARASEGWYGGADDAHSRVGASTGLSLSTNTIAA